MYIDRKWINQPSTLQPLHEYHGTNVLAEKLPTGDYCVYLLSGEKFGITPVPARSLSPGWAPTNPLNETPVR
jgi:hypothetical protein